MIGGRIDRFTKDSIWLMPEYEELNTQNIKGIKIHSKKQFPKGTIPKVAFNKNEIIYLDLQSDKDIKWTEAGHVLTFLGSLTTLIIAPLVSIEYGNKGKFHSNRYYKWAAVGLGMVGVAIPIYVSSKKKKFDLTFYDNNVKRIWHFEN
ncbi:MAG: hypothetical protein GY705_10525 [Bacteroidetes bacterium]|nr:hypothetical protein [Bacteroidota bacterium]